MKEQQYDHPDKVKYNKNTTNH